MGTQTTVRSGLLDSITLLNYEIETAPSGTASMLRQHRDKLLQLQAGEFIANQMHESEDAKAAIKALKAITEQAIEAANEIERIEKLIGKVATAVDAVAKVVTVVISAIS